MKAIPSMVVLSCAAIAIGFALVGTTPAAASKHSTKMHPKITASAARSIARARVPGEHFKSYELERESGRLIYSFEFVKPGKSGIDEVNVDAMSGSVVGVKHESPRAERQEMAKEKKEGSGH